MSQRKKKDKREGSGTSKRRRDPPALNFEKLTIDDQRLASFGLNENPAPLLLPSQYERYVKNGNEIPMPIWVPFFSAKWMKILSKNGSTIIKGRKNPPEKKNSTTAVPSIMTTILDCLHEANDPYWATLHLVSSVADSIDKKLVDSSFARLIVVAFEKCSRILVDSRNLMVKPSVNAKKAAFLVAFRQKDDFVQHTLCRVYELHENAELFLPFIQRDVHDERYDLAARKVSHFALHSHFLMQDILYPLYLESRWPEIESYLSTSAEQRNWLVHYLDGIYSYYKANEQNVYTLSPTPSALKNQVFNKLLFKAVDFLVKKYDVPSKYYPNISHRRATVSISYVLNLFYVEGNIPPQDFPDILLEIVAGDESLQCDLVTKMAPYDVRGAAWMALSFLLPMSELPLEVWYFMNANAQKMPSRSRPQIAEVEQHKDVLESQKPISYKAWKSEVKVCGSPAYSPKMPTMVRTIYDAKIFAAEVAKIRKSNIAVVAIDCKWKLNFDSSSPRLSLLLFATNEVILIVDVLNMEHQPENEHWHEFIELMSDRKLLKLAFDFAKRCCVALVSIPPLKNVAKLTNNLLDLKDLCDGILKTSPTVFPYFSSKEAVKSQQFESYIELCLGVTLDKQEEFSKWDRRPLRPSQEERAVSDVHCVLDVYTALQKSGKASGIVDLKQFLPKCTNTTQSNPDVRAIGSRDDNK